MPEWSGFRHSLRSLLRPGGTSVHSVLAGHFLRQFFQSGEAAAVETPMVRALAGAAAPMLIAAFWIVTLAHGVQPWSLAGIHYLFVLYSFCAMGCVTTLQWERLFPDRTDFLVLLPMPLRGSVLFAAKLRAVAVLLGLFLFAANIFGILLLPALAGRQVLSAMVVHAAAVFSAGLASSLAVLALESLLVALVPERWFRSLVPLVQVTLVAGFVGVFLQVTAVTAALPVLLGGNGSTAHWFAPLLFLSVYEVGAGGETATALAHTLARQASVSIPVLLLLTLALYPLAWKKRKRTALEGTRSAALRDARIWNVVVHRSVLRSADARAVFHFMRQTVGRLKQYHVRLAAYAGAGLALCCTLAMRMDWRPNSVHAEWRRAGEQAALPLLLFWTVSGLRTAFLLPADMGARWIFRLADLRTQRVVSTAKLFVFVACCALVALLLAALGVSGYGFRALCEQAVYGVCYSVLLIDCFFFLEAHIPFTRPLLTERSSLPMTLAVYIFGIPLWLLLAVALERWAGHSVWRVGATWSAAAALHALLHWLRALPSHPVPEDSFADELSEQVQTLGLSR